MIIPDLEYTFYGPIVFGAIMTGIIVACLLMKKAGAQDRTVVYTALLTFISILVFSFMVSIMLSGNIRRVGFVGAGGALGLIVGAFTSALIMQDHTSDSLTIWILVAPLMYGLSKIACHIAGCCNGIPYDGPFCVTYVARGESCFPVQLTETFVFLLIFMIGLVIYMRTLSSKEGKSWMGRHLASIILLFSAFAKIGLEFLRESHIGRIISGYQILVLCIALAGILAIEISQKNKASKTD